MAHWLSGSNTSNAILMKPFITSSQPNLPHLDTHTHTLGVFYVLRSLVSECENTVFFTLVDCESIPVLFSLFPASVALW